MNGLDHFQAFGPGRGERPPAGHNLRLWPEYRHDESIKETSEMQTEPDTTHAVRIYDVDTCEQIFHAALAAGDIQGVEAALTVMAPQDPHRAQELLDMVRVGLALADRRPTSDTPAVVGRRAGTR